ncbi:one cut domain family member 2-like isoform X2 [Planococcus citri]|uniref:one cut domain family member 2-like isoform X2 n=1 Tax=Planococcus citri TaxID=170843 RepID=UPI0031F796EC
MEEMPITMGEGHQLHGDSTAATITPIRGGTSALAALAARAHVELANLQREELSRPAVLIPAPSSNNTRNGKESVIEEVPVTAIKIDYSNSRGNFCNKRKKFSVIVNHPDDSRDSDDVGSDKISNNSASSVGSMVDCQNTNNDYGRNTGNNNSYQTQQQSSYPHISNLNGRMSPQRYSPNSSYATLTPLQPLPPISTVSDKFAYGHSSNVTGSFTVMQHNIAMGIGVHSPYSYDKIMSPPHPYSSNIVMHQQNSPDSPQSTYSQNGLSSPPRSSSPNSCYDSPYNQDIVRDQVTSSQSPNISPRSASMGSPPPASHIVGPGGYATNTAHNTMPSSIMPAINGLISAAHVIASTSGRCSPLSPPLVHSRQPSLIQSLAMGSPPIDQPPPISPPPEPPQPPSLPQHLQPLTPTNLTHHQQIQQAILAQHIENEVVVVSSPSPPNHIQQHHNQQQQQQQHHQLQAQQQLQRPQQQQQHPPPPLSPQQTQQSLSQHQPQPHNQVQTCIQAPQQQIRPQIQQQITQQQNNVGQPTNANQQQPQSQPMSVLKVIPHNNVSTPMNATVNNTTDMEEINTKELAQRISAELKRYSIPQAIFAQRVLCRSQGTLSDLLRNPKPWSKLKSGRETFRRMWKWLQEPEFQRMSALRLAAAQVPQRSTPTTNNTTTTTTTTPCKRKEEPTQNTNTNNNNNNNNNNTPPKKPRLVFTDLQRRTLQAIFKETKRPSKEMQVTIARQLGLEPTTVGNFFMNARRRSMDKWKEDEPPKSASPPQQDFQGEPIPSVNIITQQPDNIL